jgi:poly(hydroxyalkanoate) depolymerase family esterase
LTVNAALLLSARAQAGSWQANAPFGATLQGDLYTPTTPAASPAVLVSIHYCTGHASNARGWFQSYADQYGFYIIAPDAGKQCFDSSATRGGDRAAIVKMVDYVVMNKGADKTRVFAAGMSSGGCMTNTLLGIYPDVFAGGSAMPGFPAGGWPAGDTTCTKCSSSPPSTDGKYWGDIARGAFEFSGTRPCVQQWVGEADEYNFDAWLPAVAAQFQNLSNLSAGTAGTGAPSGWNRTVYKDTAGTVRLETNSKPGQKHDIGSANPPVYGDVIKFLGLDQPTGACGLTTSGTGGAGGMSSMGGAPSTGGASTGGASAGGATTAGAPSSGGASGAGGIVSSSGGASAAGGISGSGGIVSSSGGTATGGAGVPTAGGPATGGSAGTAGVPMGTGGSTAATGGTGNTAGRTGAAGSVASGGTSSPAVANSVEPPDETGGCGISLPGGSARGALASLLAVGLGVFFARRRRSRS